MAEVSAPLISVVCPCGKKLKAPASAVGKKAKCPKCGNVMTVPPPPPPVEDDSLDALYDLAAESEQAAQRQQLSPRCPGCQREMAAGAVLCTNCGFDTRSGKTIAAKPAATGTRYDPAKAAAAEAEAKKRKGTAKDKMAPQASYWKGLAACIGGAAIGGVIWFLIAFFTGYELYFVVLLVGTLAGLGMQWGQQGYSYLGGFTAAGVTFLTMVIARLAVVVALIVPMMRAEFNREVAEEEALRMPDLSMYDDRVVEQFHTEEMKRLRKSPQPAAASGDEDAENEDEDEDAGYSAYEKQEIAAYQAVEEKLKKMPKPQYEALVKKLDKEEQERRLQWLLTDEILIKDLHYNPAQAGEVLTRQARNTAKERIAAMTEAQRESEYKRLNAEEEKRRAEVRKKAQAEAAARRARGDDDGESAARSAAFAIGGIVVFFLIFGGIKGCIFTLIALGLAYRTASGSISDS